MSHDKVVLEDVNLDNFYFSADGKSVSLSFLDMSQGHTVLTLRCSGVVIFEYHNAFFDSDGLPEYVGHLTVERIPAEWLKSTLTQMGYRFGADDDPRWPHLDSCFLIHVEGGEVFIRILCRTLGGDPPMAFS